jgi:hypothetical protein
MVQTDFLASEITLRYGTVQRARDCFLYTRKGVRLTDLCQEGGRAILGWGGGAAFTVFKNTLNRGLTGSFDTDYEARIAKAVSGLLASDRTVFVFTDRTPALQVSLSFSKENTSFWRPWNQENCNWSTTGSVVVVPPLPWTPSVYLVAVMKETADAEASAGNFPGSVRIPAPLAAAVTRSIYDMIAALQTRSEKDWFIYDPVLTRYWTRRGPYLYPKVSENAYTAFILHCLDCGIVISPDYNTPSIVPYGADFGVFTKLKKAPFNLPE